MMPRTAQQIVNRANELARRFEEQEPDPAGIRDASSLQEVRNAFQRRAATEQQLAEAVRTVRDDGQSWTAIGAMLGTSGEAARQRYGAPATKRP